MTQGDAKQAIEAACTDGLKKVFGILAANLIDQTPAQARHEFKAACEFHLHALSVATSVVEEVFK